MKYYETFMKINKMPSVKWRESLQEMVIKQFDNASSYHKDIEEEVEFGTFIFRTIDIRINSIVDAKTGQRVNDDYKKLIFKDIDYKPDIGTRYRFDNNIWIVFSTDNIKTDTSSVYIRRCNNTVNIQDKYGNIHKEPCYIDYKVTENQLFKEYTMDVPSGRIWIQLQKNKYTQDININDRYMFSGDVYKIRERTRFDRRYTFSEETTHTLSFYADYDNKNEYDNSLLQIADYRIYDYKIVTQSEIKNIVSFKNKIDTTIYLDDGIVSEPVIWESTNNNIAKIDYNTGEFILLNIGKCEFVCTMINKPDVSVIVQIEVVSEIEKSYTTIVYPDISRIKLNSNLTYSIYEYENDIEINTGFVFKATNIDNKHFILTVVNENEFNIVNIKPCSENLIIEAKNTRTDEITLIEVELGGVI